MVIRELRTVPWALAGVLLLTVLGASTAEAGWVDKYLTLNGCDFVPAGHTMEVDYNGCVIDPFSANAYFYWAAFHLPDGARIQTGELSATICRDPGTPKPPAESPITVQIYLRSLADPTDNPADPISSFSTIDPGCTLQSDPPVFSADHYVDNSIYSYTVRVNQLKPGFELHAVRIAYQVEEPWDCLECLGP